MYFQIFNILIFFQIVVLIIGKPIKPVVPTSALAVKADFWGIGK
jgi:hypothetical protein